MVVSSPSSTPQSPNQSLHAGRVAENNAKLVPHIAHTVEIVGDVTMKYGELMIAANDLKMIKK